MPDKTINRIESVDILKGIAILTVVVGHSGFGSYITKYLATFHMQVFFFLSGLLYKPNKYPCFGDFCRRKARTILVPYCFFAVITIVLCTIVSIITRSNPYNFPGCLLGIIWSNRSLFPITGGIWFLQCLFWVELVFWFFESHTSHNALYGVMLLFLLLAYVQSQSNIMLPFAIDSALSAVVFYGIGYFSKPFWERCVACEKNKMKAFLISFCFLLSGAVLAFVNGDVNPRTCTYAIYPLYYLTALLTIVGLSIFACLLEKSENGFMQRVNAGLIRCGKHSIVFLGFNQIIINGLYYLSNVCFPFATKLQKGLRNIGICAISCILLYCMTFLFERTRLRVLVGK